MKFVIQFVKNRISSACCVFWKRSTNLEDRHNMSRLSNARSWCVTSFKVADCSLPEPTGENSLRYGIISPKEVCPETSREHYHFYLEFSKTVSFRHVQRLLGDEGAHCEHRKGTREEARRYCTGVYPDGRNKEIVDGTEYRECGVWSDGGQGARNDLSAVKRKLDAGESMAVIASDHFEPWIKYNRAFGDYRLLTAGKRSWPMEVLVLWGETETGKTRHFWDNYGDDAYTLCHSNGAVWFDGYDGEHNVLVDDFYGWLPWSFLLQLLDRYPMRVPTKHGHKPFVSKRIVFTSNVHPREWYDFANKSSMKLEALMRRITRITHFTSLGIQPTLASDSVVLATPDQSQRVDWHPSDDV